MPTGWWEHVLAERAQREYEREMDERYWAWMKEERR